MLFSQRLLTEANLQQLGNKQVMTLFLDGITAKTPIFLRYYKFMLTSAEILV